MAKGSTEKQRKGGRKGGIARAKNLSSKRRSEIARKAAEARWSEGDGQDVAKATHMGTLEIGDAELPCAVLKDGRRVISERGVLTALGRKKGGRQAPGGEKLPRYLDPMNLKPFIPNDLVAVTERPIYYRHNKGGGVAHGILATALPQVCEVWLKARDAGVLLSTQMHMAEKADVLMRGLATVGIIALVDEATGYQEERDRNELNKILSAYISEELMPWTRRFPESFYQELFRLHGWSYKPMTVRRPMLFGRRTAELIYDKLPPGVVQELRRKNPVLKKGRRRHKHHQYLTEDVGNQHLSGHLAAVTALMRASPNWKSFKRLFDRAFPGDQLALDLGQDEADDA